MTKRRVITLVVLAISVGLLLPIVQVKSQPSSSGDYGAAFFYRSDIWPRDGLVEHWTFDSGVQGDVRNGEGDFETWTGTEGGCTDCPAGWNCDCTSWGGEIDQETTYIYSLDSSAKLTASGLLHSLIYYTESLAANTAYQVDFCYMGDAGTEDLLFVITNGAMNDSYNFAIDTWTAPATWLSIANVGTTWSCVTAYVVTGVAAKASYLWGFAAETTDGNHFYVDHVRVQKLNAVDITGDRGNVLSIPVTSDPQWGHSQILQARTGTGPAYKTGMHMDGVDDYLFCSDSDCDMDPVNWAGGGYFSVGCRVMTNTVAAGTDYIITKWNAGGNQRSWVIYRQGANIAITISDDGINTDANLAAMFTADVLHSFVSTYDPSGGSGACESNLYYNASQVDADATMTECVPFNSTADLQIGATVGSSTWSGSILECSLWEKELTAVEANKYISPYFPGTNYNDGFYVDTCSQTASHATCSIQACRDGTPKVCQAEGTGVMAIFDQASNLPENNSFEANSGTDDTPDFDDWQELGTGSGDVNCPGSLTAYHADKVHGDSSMRMKLRSIFMDPANRFLGGTVKDYPTCSTYVWVASECLNTSKNDTTFSMKIKALSDTIATTSNLNGFYVYVAQYTAGCASKLQDNFFEYDPKKGDWEDFIFTLESSDWNASAAAYYLSIVANSGWNIDILVDDVQITETPYKVPWAHVPAGGGVVTYNNRQYELHNPLSDYCESEGDDCYASGFCASAWVYTDWAGDDGVGRRILFVPGTAGNNNRWDIRKDAANNLQFYFYDNAAAIRNYGVAVTGVNWTAGDWKYVEVCSNNSDNVLLGHHYNVGNSTWYTWSNAAGAGTGIQNGQSVELHVGHQSNASYLDGYISEIHISPYSDIYPNKGFNNGVPPVNKHPYAGYICPWTEHVEIIP